MTTANTETIRTAVGTAVATAVGLTSDHVEINSITATTRRLSDQLHNLSGQIRRSPSQTLLAAGVVVAYTITLSNSLTSTNITNPEPIASMCELMMSKPVSSPKPIPSTLGLAVTA